MSLIWSKLKGLTIRTEGKSRPITFVEDVLVHPETGQILAYETSSKKILSPVDIRSINEAAILIKNEESLQDFQEIARLKEFGLHHCRLLSKPVLSKSGHKIGKVVDLQIDNVDNRISSLIVSKKFLIWNLDQRIFSIEDIDRITKKAVHLNLNTEDPKGIPLTRAEFS